LQLIREKNYYKSELPDENKVYQFVESYLYDPINFSDSILCNFKFARILNNFLKTISNVRDAFEMDFLIKNFEYGVISNTEISKEEKDALLIYFATFRNSSNFWIEYSKNEGKKFPFPAWVVYGADAIGLVSGIITTPLVALPLAALVSYGAYRKE
jgi:hypothetical protein